MGSVSALLVSTSTYAPILCLSMVLWVSGRIIVKAFNGKNSAILYVFLMFCSSELTPLMFCPYKVPLLKQIGWDLNSFSFIISLIRLLRNYVRLVRFDSFTIKVNHRIHDLCKYFQLYWPLQVCGKALEISRDVWVWYVMCHNSTFYDVYETLNNV